VFLALCFYFFSFFSFLLPFHHNISYHSERVEASRWPPSRARGI
jgi:hypothetical protein